MSEEKRRRFSENLLLFYTGVTRKADNILPGNATTSRPAARRSIRSRRKRRRSMMC
jgi:galactokinase/mevalonate kinase-like predicted kinase